MRIFVLICIFITMILSSCDGIFDIKPRYNPERAGASIVESYDLAKRLSTSLQGSVSDYAIYNDKIYILADGIINVFQKDNFEKSGEIQVVILNKPGDNVKIDYDELVVVSEEKGVISCSFRISEDNGYSYGSHIYSLISVNLQTGDAEFMDMPKTGIQHEEGVITMGYDKINEYIWFWSYSSTRDIYFYTYDAEYNTFLFEKKIEHISNSEDMHIVTGLFIYGDEWFYTGCSMGYFGPNNTEIFKYNVNIPGEFIYSIRTEYLETGGSGHIMYDKPYIWMPANKDGKLQMLKLLPNE